MPDMRNLAFRIPGTDRAVGVLIKGSRTGIGSELGLTVTEVRRESWFEVRPRRGMLR